MHLSCTADTAGTVAIITGPRKPDTERSHESGAIGLRSLGLVILNLGIFILFAFSFFKPRTGGTGDRSGHSALPGGVVREIWLPAQHLPAVGMAAEPLPRIDWLSHDSAICRK
jgi:hypothetical protein